VTRLEYTPNSRLKSALGYPKLNTDSVVCAILGNQYHLQKECARTLKNLGHTPITIPIQESASGMMRETLQTLIQHKPDMLLAINHLGFDDGNTLGNLIDECEIPTAVWYCDNPLIILGNNPIPAPKMTSLFIWERNYISALKKNGAQDIHYLPLATDPSVFSPSNRPITREYCFVGSSMERAIDKFFSRLTTQGVQVAHQLAQEQQADRSLDIEKTIKGLYPEIEPAEFWNLMAAGCWQGTADYRTKLLENLNQEKLTIIGDDSWPDILPDATYEGFIAYGPKIAEVYETSTININATSLQMATAINQRVFDVPTAGGFLLTDNQSDVGEHFELGKEVITYSSGDELADLAGYYLQNETQRQTIIQNAQTRISREHLYEHRLEILLSTMKKRYS